MAEPKTGQGAKGTPPEDMIKDGYVTKEEAAKMVEEASARSAREALALYVVSQQSITAASTKAEEKPFTERSNRGIPDEHFLKEDFTVFHLNYSHCFDAFEMADGRLIEPPRSRVIVFSHHSFGSGQRFGNADNVVVVCAYRTRDAREKKLFLEDRRWNNEFWEQSALGVRADDIEGQQLVAEWTMRMKDLPFRELRAQCAERGIGSSGDVTFMRVELAMFEAKREMAERKAARSLGNVEKQKEELLKQ